MKKFLDNHMVVTMPMAAWLAWPVCLYIFRHAYVTPLPWHECIRIVTWMIAFCSVVFALMGWLADMTNRDRLKRAFLRKLES